MSLQHAAQHLAAKGRGPDTELIHMTKGEIAGLQALAKAHGGSLTVNPHTGLAEAGFLSSILPMAIGAAITATTGIPAWQVGLGMGALGTLATGNLGKGVMAGLGAYGGGQLASGIAGLGTSEAGANLSQANQAAMESLGADSSARDIILARDATAANAMANAPLKTGFDAFIDSPSKLAPQMGGYGNLAKAGAMAAAPALSGMMEQKPLQATANQRDTDMGPRYRFDPGTATPQPGASATGVENTYFPTQGYTRISDADAKALYGYADGGNVQFPYGESVMRMARGGLSDLGGYSDGGRLLRGPGDGVSDSIPAVIGRKQPARLADGEFVVPARIVSELGNGSTEAGARQLYKMMDRVQKARGKTTGKGKVAKNTRAAKYLPA